MKTFKFKIIHILIGLIFCFFQQPAGAQPTVENVEGPKSLPHQYEVLKDKAETYQEYKVIKSTRLEKFWSNVEDSIQNLEQNLVTANTQIFDQKKAITELSTNLGSTQKKLEESNFLNDKIQVLGMPLVQSNFLIGVLLTMIALVVFMVILFLKSKTSQNYASKKKKDFQTVDQEYEEFRKRAREREIKLKRELQTAVNTLEELKQKTAINKI